MLNAEALLRMADQDTSLSKLIEMMLRLTTSLNLCVPLYCCDPPEFPLHWHCLSTSGCPTWKEILFSHRHLFCDLYIEIIMKGIYICARLCRNEQYIFYSEKSLQLKLLVIQIS